MKILFLAPHPFYQNRGTPIAVKLFLNNLSDRGDEVDVLTYHEGENVSFENVKIYRAANLFGIKNVRPGFSWKKILCDICMALKLISLLMRKRYDMVHAVEESVYMAIFIKYIFRVPYVYDMDSSIAQQIVDKYPRMNWCWSLLDAAEKFAIRQAAAVVPVCRSLEEMVKQSEPHKKTFLLQDISLLMDEKVEHGLRLNLKEDLGIKGLIVMYVGNMESYQGIDFLLESFKKMLQECNSAHLVMVGGEDEDIKKYKEMSMALGISDFVHFLGPKPIDLLGEYCEQADVLVSPRIQGKNTPMKIYSYLHSGKPVLATEIESHTQVLNTRVAMLSAVNSDEFSRCLLNLVEDGFLRRKLGNEGKRLAEQNHSFHAYEKKVNKIYDWVLQRNTLTAGGMQK